MKLLIQLISACLVAFPLVAKEPSNLPSLLQVCLVLDQPTEDSEQMTTTGKGAGKDAGKTFQRTISVQKQPLMDFTAVKKAAVTKHPLSGEPMIEITLTDEGKKQFAELTRKNIRRQLAIIIDGKIYATPKIAGEIQDGKLQILGSDSKEAMLAVNKLNTALNVHH